MSETIRRTVGAAAAGLLAATLALASPAGAKSPSTMDGTIATFATPTGTASIYGVLADRRLTYTTIDVASGNRTKVVLSRSKLAFTPKAMATLNFNTILITSTGGSLYRIDVITNNTSLVFNTPVRLASDGWTHDRLAYDGTGKLFGIADGGLRRYDVTSTKPTMSSIRNNTFIGDGFTLKTLTATGPSWIVGTTSSGMLLSYRIFGAGSWNRYVLKSSSWGGIDSLLSPGGGVYYGRSRRGLYRYLDVNPYNGSGTDIVFYTSDPVDTSGWTQALLSAHPAAITVPVTGPLATKAAQYVGGYAREACRDAGMYPLRHYQCKQFMSCLVKLVYNKNIGGGYYAPYANAGFVRVSKSAARAGDIVQLNGSNRELFYSGMHTAVLTGGFGGDNYATVIDSNFGGDSTGYELVRRHSWNPYAQASSHGLAVNIWRYAG